MLIMVEKRITCGICHVIDRYAKANNKYMKNFNKSKDLSYIMHLMETKFPVNGFKWKKKHVVKI